MTVASGFVPQQPDPADMRPQEPSMEDILASIRRIIADDQTQGLRSGYDPPPREAPSALDTVAPEPDRVVGSVPPTDRGRQRSRKTFEGVLDLASLPGAAFAEDTPSGYEERPLASSGAEAPLPPEPGNDHEGSPAEDSYGSFQESVDAASEASAAYREGQESSTLFRTQTMDQHATQIEHAAQPAPMFGLDGPDDDSSPAEDSAAFGDALISPALSASVMSAFETLAATVVLQNTEMLERTMRELLRPMVKTWLDENLPTLVERLVRNEIERVARGGRG